MRRFISIALIAIVLASFSGVLGYTRVAFAGTGSSVATTTDGTATNQSSIAENKVPTESQYGPIMTFVMNLFAWLMGTAAITLDNAAYFTVVTMGNYINNLTAVGVVWQILRDIGNIILIFGFLAVGISTILDVNWYGGGTKFLPTLLIVAVLLNFSLFLSEAVVDIGNVFATEIYSQINGGVPISAEGFSISNIQTEGISTKILDNLGLQTLYGNALTAGQSGSNKNSVLGGNNEFFVGFLGIILFLIAAFVMFSLAFVLIARFIILLFLIIISPAGIAMFAVPPLQKFGQQWQSELIKQTITAPILLLLLYIALRVITDSQFLVGFIGAQGAQGASSAWTGWLSGSQGGVQNYAGMLLSFLIAMGLLLAVVIVAKQLKAFGAKTASKVGTFMSIGAPAAVLGFAGRKTLGKGSSFMSRQIRKSSFGRSDLGRTVAGVFDRGAKATYDVRNTTAAKKFEGLPGVKDAGFTTGTGGSKHSYEDTRTKNIEARMKYNKSLKNTAEEEAEKERLEKIIGDKDGGLTKDIADQKKKMNKGADIKEAKEAYEKKKKESEDSYTTNRNDLEAKLKENENPFEDEKNDIDERNRDFAAYMENLGKSQKEELQKADDDISNKHSALTVSQQTYSNLQAKAMNGAKDDVQNAETARQALDQALEEYNKSVQDRETLATSQQKTRSDLEKKNKEFLTSITDKYAPQHAEIKETTKKAINDLDKGHEEELKRLKDASEKFIKNIEDTNKAALKKMEKDLKKAQDELENTTQAPQAAYAHAIASTAAARLVNSVAFGSGPGETASRINAELKKKKKKKNNDASVTAEEYGIDTKKFEDFLAEQEANS